MEHEHPVPSKRIRSRLRQLANEAHERELRTHLRQLHSDFEAWRRGDITGVALHDRIQEHQEGPARDVFQVYSTMKPDRIVARAVALGILDASAIEKEILELLRKDIEGFRMLLESE